MTTPRRAPRIIDLTLTLRPGMRGVEIEPTRLLERDGWNAATLHLYSHCGTHMDAAMHFEAGPETIDEIPLERLMGPAWIVNLSGIAPKALISVADLGGVEKRFAPGDGLLLRTDWSRLADRRAYRDALPRVSLSLAQWLVARKARFLGVEPPSVADVNNLAEVAQVHKTLLAGGVTIIEGLAGLDALSGNRAFFAALPLKIGRGDGSPCRAFAIEGTSPKGWFE